MQTRISSGCAHDRRNIRIMKGVRVQLHYEDRINILKVVWCDYLFPYSSVVTNWNQTAPVYMERVILRCKTRIVGKPVHEKLRDVSSKRQMQVMQMYLNVIEVYVMLSLRINNRSGIWRMYQMRRIELITYRRTGWWVYQNIDSIDSTIVTLKVPRDFSRSPRLLRMTWLKHITITS